MNNAPLLSKNLIDSLLRVKKTQPGAFVPSWFFLFAPFIGLSYPWLPLPLSDPVLAKACYLFIDDWIPNRVTQTKAVL